MEIFSEVTFEKLFTKLGWNLKIMVKTGKNAENYEKSAFFKNYTFNHLGPYNLLGKRANSYLVLFPYRL